MADTRKDFYQHPTMRPVDRILEGEEKVRKTNSGWNLSCPTSDHSKGRGDKNPSLSGGKAVGIPRQSLDESMRRNSNLSSLQ
jgi:hypothetical protein